MSGHTRTKLGSFIAAMLIGVYAAHGAQPSPDFSAGVRYLEKTEFGKAAVRFAVACNADGNSEACYWTGIAYERLADTRIPFGCRAAAKAHTFLAMAVKLAPQEPSYRDALFNFLLDDGDCSRAALPEAAGILSRVPQSNPEHDLMRTRLEAASQWNSSAAVRLGNLFLAIPRASYRISASSGALVTKRRKGSESPESTPRVGSERDSQVESALSVVQKSPL